MHSSSYPGFTLLFVVLKYVQLKFGVSTNLCIFIVHLKNTIMPKLQIDSVQQREFTMLLQQQLQSANESILKLTLQKSYMQVMFKKASDATYENSEEINKFYLEISHIDKQLDYMQQNMYNAHQALRYESSKSTTYIFTKTK